MSTTYAVEIDYRLKGDPAAAFAPVSAKLAEIESRVSKVGDALKSLGGPVEVGLKLRDTLVSEVKELAAGLDVAQKSATDLKGTLDTLKVDPDALTPSKLPGGKAPGDMKRPLQETQRETSKLGDSMSSLGSKAARAFTGAVEKVGMLTVALAAAGAAAGVGAVTHGVLALNKELENTKISLAAVFSTQGVARDMTDGLAKAADTVARMRRDAAALPGEMSDLLTIFQTIAPSGFQSGASRQQLEGLAAQAMAASKVLSIQSDQAGRELAMLLEGRAGAHNVLGMRLGIGADEQASAFNRLSAADRLKRITDELKKFEPSFAIFEKSFDGASSAFQNNARELLRVAAEPVFGKLTGTLTRINKWFDANEARVSAWASMLGTKLGEAWDWGAQKVEEWGPAVEAFALTAFVKLRSIWDDLKPHVEAFGKVMQEALKDPGTIDKLITLLKVYGAVKVAGGVADAVGGWGNVGKGLGWAGRGLKAGASSAIFEGGIRVAGWTAGLGGAAQGVAAATGAGTAAAAGAAGGAAAAGAAGGAAAGGTALLVGGTAVAAAAAAAAIGGLALAGWQAKELYTEWARDADADGRAWYDAGLQMAEAAARSAEAHDHVTTMIRKLELAGYEAEAEAVRLKLSFAETADGAERLAAGLADIRDGVDPSFWDPYRKLGMHPDLDVAVLQGLAKGATQEKKSPRHPGGAGMNIQKVEIVVTSNQDPSRIARLLTSELANLRRHPRVSPHVPNYSASL